MSSASAQTRIRGGTPRTDTPPRLLPNNTAWAISLILFLFIWPVVYGIDTREFEVPRNQSWSRFLLPTLPGDYCITPRGPGFRAPHCLLVYLLACSIIPC